MQDNELLCGSCGWYGVKEEAELEDMGTEYFCPDCGADLRLAALSTPRVLLPDWRPVMALSTKHGIPFAEVKAAVDAALADPLLASDLENMPSPKHTSLLSRIWDPRAGEKPSI